MLFYSTDKSYIDIINKKKVAVWINTVLLTSRFLVFTNVMLKTISSKTYFVLMDKLGLLVNSSLTQKCRTCTVRQLEKMLWTEMINAQVILENQLYTSNKIYLLILVSCCRSIFTLMTYIEKIWKTKCNSRKSWVLWDLLQVSVQILSKFSDDFGKNRC